MEFARKNRLPWVPSMTHDFPYTLVFGKHRVELHGAGAKPLFVDFVAGTMGYRRRAGGGFGQAIARAVGLKSGKPCPFVVDATAGLGRDSFVLATLGCTVLAMERSPVLFCLLKDGLERALGDPETRKQVESRLNARHADARVAIPEISLSTPPEVVFVDPMHPSRGKSALVKKEMRVLKEIVGEDSDRGELLDVALAHASKRVVVKLPLRAGPIAPNPRRQLAGKTTRFDIYLR